MTEAIIKHTLKPQDCSSAAGELGPPELILCAKNQCRDFFFMQMAVGRNDGVRDGQVIYTFISP